MEILNNKEFDVLVYLENRQNKCIDFASLMCRLNLSAEAIKFIVSKLIDLHYVVKHDSIYKVTEEAYRYLEPHKVKRAVLLAAGLGSRMRPVTLDCPKPLVKVNGVALIETLIEALLEKDICDITIVTGYLEHKFDDLKKKYPNIHFVYNCKYNEENNISSAMLVKDLYSNAYVMDADLYLSNRDIIRKYEYGTNYLGVWVDKTDDWNLKIINNRVTNMVYGGENTYLMVGLSYWSMQDGQTFKDDIVRLYNSENGKQKYWDDVALTEFNEHYNIRVRPCLHDDIIEIDSIQELAAMDEIYKRFI